MRVIILGAPGAGKGTQAALLSEKLGLAHIASGDLFRQAQDRGDELGAIAKSYMERGLLVPDEVVIEMILERIAAPDCIQGFILDGFPRTMQQAQALDHALRANGIDQVLYIKVSDEELIRRLSGRLLCRNCQAPYHVINNPPRMPGRCDLCGGELYQRPDDDEETVRKRIEVYMAQTMPVIDYYAKMGKLTAVDGEQDIEAVSNDLLAALGRGNGDNHQNP
jgi:adenylate kinase